MVFATHWYWNLGFLRLFGFLYGFGYPLILESCFCCVCLFSGWFWLSQWSSHLHRFGFLDGFKHSFCDQSCLKLHPIYYFSRPLFALPTRMSNNVWIQRVALQLASVRVFGHKPPYSTIFLKKRTSKHQETTFHKIIDFQGTAHVFWHSRRTVFSMCFALRKRQTCIYWLYWFPKYCILYIKRSTAHQWWMPQRLESKHWLCNSSEQW